MTPTPHEHPVAIVDFFERDLPARLARGRATSAGNIAICVRGVGEWTVSWADRKVARRFDWNAPLSLWFSPAAFGALLQGELAWDLHTRDGSVAAYGDLALLESLATLVEGAK
jgi:hypothetical protein